MLSQYIGLIVGTTTRSVYAVVNPEHNDELDNPKHLLLRNELREPVQMVKVERGAMEACMTPEDVETLINQWYATTSRVQEGVEYIDAL